jgi:CBS domain-containing protein
MKTRDLCSRDVVTANPEATLAEISRLMRSKHVGSVVITDEAGAPAGIVSDRDIVVEVLAMGLDPQALTAGEIMTPGATQVTEDEDALWTLKVMRDRGVRRLPVVNSKGALVGVLAFDDLLQHLGSTLGDMAHVIGTARWNEQARRA